MLLLHMFLMPGNNWFEVIFFEVEWHEPRDGRRLPLQMLPVARYAEAAASIRLVAAIAVVRRIILMHQKQQVVYLMLPADCQGRSGRRRGQERGTYSCPCEKVRTY